MADNGIINGALISAANQTIKTPQATTDQKQARETAESFEAVFLSQMLEHMFSGIKTDGMFGGGYSEGIYRSMMNEQYAEAMTKSGGIGIADAVYRQILKMQEV